MCNYCTDYYLQMKLVSMCSKEQVNCKDVDKNAAAYDKRDLAEKNQEIAMVTFNAI